MLQHIDIEYLKQKLVNNFHIFKLDTFQNNCTVRREIKCFVKGHRLRASKHVNLTGLDPEISSNAFFNL